MHENDEDSTWLEFDNSKEVLVNESIGKNQCNYYKIFILIFFCYC